ncbi:MAG TPA: DUF4349 domain-containing protein [Fimbriimonas sp.]|nr:DUF4349 domain-containing protein [Fimbriimonas sp.]
MREDLKAFVDGELPAEESEAIRRELETDGALAQEVAFLKLVGQEIRATAGEPHIFGAEEAMARFRGPKRFRFPSWVLPATLVLLIVPGAILKMSSGSAQNETSMAASPSMVTFADKSGTGGNMAAAPRISMKENMRNAMPMESGVSSGRQQETMGDLREKDFATRGAAAAKAAPMPQLRIQGGVDLNRSIDRPAGLNDAAGRSPASQNQAAKMPAPEQNLAASKRMVIQNGDLALVVPDVSRAQSEAMNYVKGLGGYIESSSLDNDANNLPIAVLAIRVPVRSFSMAMEHLKGMASGQGSIKSVHVTGQDVTAQYADTNARLKELTAEEDSYVQMLHGARHIDDVLTIKDRLSQVRQDIASLQAQSAALKDESAMSRIAVSFEQKPKTQAAPPQPKQASWAEQSWSDAEGGLVAFGKVAAGIAIYLFVYCPIWLPLVLLGIWLNKKRV